jgi:hypothetical protein
MISQSESASVAPGALLKLFDKLGINSFRESAMITLSAHVANRSVALLLREGEKLSVGSGVCVRIGDRYLIATAKHNLQDDNGHALQISDIEVRSRGEKFGEPITVCRVGLSPFADLAWLEMNPEASIRPRLAFATLGDLASLREDEQRACFLLGYPAAMAEKPDSVQQCPLLESTCMGTVSIVPANRGEQETFTIEWPPHDGSLGDSLPEPYGISGAGVWSVPRHDEYRVWSAERATLVGIETAWRGNHKELVVMRIERWLELVAGQIPEVSGEIAATLEKISS